MEWPRRPVEQIPHDRFVPPFCPRADCPQHHPDPDQELRYKKNGCYTRKGDGRRVQSYHCKVCGGGFSQQSFAWSYYLKRPRLGPEVAALLNSGCAHRQIARALRCAPSTVTRLVGRLGRHALLLHCRLLEYLAGIDEPVVLDHFETFVFSQLDALGLGTAVGHQSWFVYALDPAPHLRGGTLTPAQQRALAQRTRPLPPPGSESQSVDRLLDVLTACVTPEQMLTLITDGDPSYASAVKRHPNAVQVEHRVHPNPVRGPKGSKRSPEARERDAAMFPADQLHALIRHSCAHHRRETIAFSRRINAALERGFLLMVWRNLVKWRSERKPDRSTPAMQLKLTDAVWNWEWVLSRRLFLEREQVPECWKRVYRRDWDDDAAGPYTRHRLKHAL